MTNFELTEKIKEILIKKAEGYDYIEETYEYQKIPADKQLSFDDILDDNQSNVMTETKSRSKGKTKYKNFKSNELSLLKKKVTTHHIPPDMIAIKILLETFGQKQNDENKELFELSDDELLKLRDNVLESLKNIEKEEDNES